MLPHSLLTPSPLGPHLAVGFPPLHPIPCLYAPQQSPSPTTQPLSPSSRVQSVAHYRFIPIHSQLPFEDQLEAFAPSPPGIVKVVVATNAAESSLTLPDVDAVIDLGLHKLLSYSTEMRSAVLRVSTGMGSRGHREGV